MNKPNSHECSLTKKHLNHANKLTMYVNKEVRTSLRFQQKRVYMYIFCIHANSKDVVPSLVT